MRPARGVALAFAKTAGAGRQCDRDSHSRSPRSTLHRIAQRFKYALLSIPRDAPLPPWTAQFRYSEIWSWHAPESQRQHM